MKIRLAALALLLLTVGLGAARSQSPAAAPRSGSTLRGRVVYSDTGNPVRRAHVLVMDAATAAVFDSAVTNVKGEFRMTGLPAGRFTLAAVAPSLAAHGIQDRADSAPDMSDLVESLHLLTEVELDGKGTADIVVRAARGGAITGRVTTEEGEPVAGARLKLFRLRRGQPVPFTPAWDSPSRADRQPKTDSRGVYRLGGLPPGEYVVRLSESDLGRDLDGDEPHAYGDGSLVVTYYPSASALKDAVPVRVYEGRDTDKVDIRLPERPARRLAGTVTLGRGGPAVVGAEIMVRRKDEGPAPRWRFGEHRTRTDGEGRWTIHGVPDGEYVLTVNSIGAAVLNDAGGMRYFRHVPARREVTVSGGDVTDVSLEVEEGRRVSGTVTVEGGAPLPELLRVAALRNGEETDFMFVRDKGDFTLTVPSGEVRIRVSGLPPDGFYLKSLTWNQVDLTREPLRVGERGGVEGVRVVLGRDVATVKGQAFSARDAATPLARAAVALVPADEKLRRAGARPTVVRADAKGRFELKAGPGEYLLVAVPEASALSASVKLDEDFVRRNLQSLTRVTLRAGATLAGVKLTGREE